MTALDVKMLGQITRFNGVNIQQTWDYIKIYNAKYLKKILQHHRWILDATPALVIPATPMRDDVEYQRELENSTSFTAAKLTAHENLLGFTYNQGIGELIYALITCRPDISFACIKLAQHLNAPTSKVHFDALQHVYLYLHATIDEGIYYWHSTEPWLDLPSAPLPTIQPDNNYELACVQELLKQINADILQATVDSDHAGNTSSHHKFVSGICVKLAWGDVLYKTQYQAIIALSSTEAEFIAACEARKYLLYLCNL